MALRPEETIREKTAELLTCRDAAQRVDLVHALVRDNGPLLPFVLLGVAQEHSHLRDSLR